ncbi:hypothetical protein BCR42DRAFT_456067 [Absidia repens]|uniref:Uncharacterized protein n=1 Tax=Absidia repens TaxID=90262 RepID=A0A1X2I1N1_9FUNG|nr:hypothetical protein BCR42DRAFT_456067 [Absidia repens]
MKIDDYQVKHNQCKDMLGSDKYQHQFLTLANIKKLLGINDAFWRHCRKSETPDIVEARYKPTLVNLDTVIDDTQDAARSCALRFGH